MPGKPKNCHPDRSVAKWRDLRFVRRPEGRILVTRSPQNLAIKELIGSRCEDVQRLSFFLCQRR